MFLKTVFTHPWPVFNQPIGGRNTSSVTHMAFMFQSNSVFNQQIGGWDTLSVTGMCCLVCRTPDEGQRAK